MIKKIILVGLILLTLISGVSLVSAETFEETYEENIYKDSKSSLASSKAGNVFSSSQIYFPEYTTPNKYIGAYFLTYDGGGYVSIPNCDEGVRYPIKCHSGSNLIFSGYITYDNDYNLLGQKTHGYFWINIEDIYVNNITTRFNSFSIYSHDYTNVLATSLTMGTIGPAWGSYTDTSIGNINFIWFIGASTLQNMGGGLHIYYRYPFETTVSGEYNVGQFSTINVERKNYVSNFTLYDLDGNLIKNDYHAGDIENFIFSKSAYRYTLQNEAGTIWEKTLQATPPETEKEYYLHKSKDGILAINESVTISVYPTLTYNELNRIVWNSYPVDANDNTISGESYLKNYVRYNVTHWQYTEAKNSVLISNGIIPQTELTNSLSINFSSIANYRITCNLFDNVNRNIGNPQINVNVGNAVSDLLQYFIRTVDAETAHGISGATLTIYKITESGEILDQTITMSGSQQEVLFSSGEIYVIRVSKDGYVTNSYTFTATESKTFTIYLSKSSDVGYSTVTFIVYDANNNRLQNAIVNLNGTIKYTNQAGITTFDNLLSDCNHPYNVSLANYQSESGTIYTDDEIEELFIRLYTITEIYPTPTTIPFNMTKPSNLKESIIFAYASVFGISDNDNANLIFAAIIIGFFAMMAGYATHSGTGILAGSCIGFVLCLGLELIPIWIFFAIVVMTVIYFVLKSGGE